MIFIRYPARGWSDIPRYSAETKISEEAEDRVGYLLARVIIRDIGPSPRRIYDLFAFSWNIPSVKRTPQYDTDATDVSPNHYIFIYLFDVIIVSLLQF